MEKNEVAKIAPLPMDSVGTISKAFYESGMFTDIKSQSQAMVKILAGQEMGFSPFAAMSGIHIIAGKPTVGAGLIASRVKGSGKYDYKVKDHSEKICSIDFYEGGQLLGNSTFTIEEAKKAQTKNLDKYPKNMLFARAVSNGVKWFAPDIFSGPVYVPEEMHEVQTVDAVAEVVNIKGSLTKKAFDAGCERIANGELGLYQKILDSFNLTPEQLVQLETTFTDANLKSATIQNPLP